MQIDLWYIHVVFRDGDRVLDKTHKGGNEVFRCWDSFFEALLADILEEYPQAEILAMGVYKETI